MISEIPFKETEIVEAYQKKKTNNQLGAPSSNMQQQQLDDIDSLDANSMRHDNITSEYGTWFPYLKLGDPSRKNSIEFHFTASEIQQGYLVMRENCDDGHREFALFESVDDFLTQTGYLSLPRGKCTFHHMLPEKRRIHFDFDGGDAPDKLAQEAWNATLEAILAMFGEYYEAGISAHDVLVCVGDKKPWSRRIYFPRFAWRNSREAKWFYKKVIECIPSKYRTYTYEGKSKVFLDPKYHALQGDRMVGSHKYASDNVLLILNEWEWEGEVIRTTWEWLDSCAALVPSDCVVVDEYCDNNNNSTVATRAVIGDAELIDYEHKVIANWKPERWTERKSWVAIAQLLKNVGYTREAGIALLCHYSSKHYKGASLDEQEELWDSLHEARVDKPIGFGTGIYWLREDNPQAYARYRKSFTWMDGEWEATSDEPQQESKDTLKLLMDGDIGCAELFSQAHRRDLVLTTKRGTGYMWSESARLWEPRNEVQVKCLIGPYLLKRIDIEIRAQTNNTSIGEGNKVLAKLIALRRNIATDRHSRGVFEKVKVSLYDTEFESLPPNPHTLPIQGGMAVDLRSGEVRERRREDGFRFECPVRLVADTLNAERFFSSVMNDDAAMVAHLQKCLGYCLTGCISARKFFVWHGIGRNGKSKVANMLEKILGGFYCTASEETFTVTRSANRHAGAATPHLMALRGARVAMLPETERGAHLNERLIKSITGGDKISARQLYGEQIEFTPICKPILPTNYKPDIKGDATAAWDRLCLTEFQVRFVDNPSEPHERQADEKFVVQCLNEYLSEVFSWMVRGAVSWYANPDLTEPATMQTHIDGYKDEMDSVGRFIRECCELDAKYSVQASELYKDYSAWSDKPMNITEFGRELGQRFEKKKVRGNFRYIGLRVRDEGGASTDLLDDLTSDINNS